MTGGHICKGGSFLTYICKWSIPGPPGALHSRAGDKGEDFKNHSFLFPNLSFLTLSIIIIIIFFLLLFEVYSYTLSITLQQRKRKFKNCARRRQRLRSDLKAWQGSLHSGIFHSPTLCPSLSAITFRILAAPNSGGSSRSYRFSASIGLIFCFSCSSVPDSPSSVKKLSCFRPMPVSHRFSPSSNSVFSTSLVDVSLAFHFLLLLFFLFF